MKKPNFESTLPTSYRVAVALDARRGRFALMLTLLSFLLTALVAVPLLIPVLLRPDAFASWDLLLFYAVLFGGYIAYMLLHELVHGAVYKMMTRQRLTFGLSWNCAFCGVPRIFTYRRCALTATLAPFVLFSIVLAPLLPLALGNVSVYFGVAMLYALHIGGCSGDLYVAGLLLLRYRDPRMLMNDTGPAMTLYIPDESAEEVSV